MYYACPVDSYSNNTDLLALPQASPSDEGGPGCLSDEKLGKRDEATDLYHTETCKSTTLSGFMYSSMSS